MVVIRNIKEQDLKKIRSLVKECYPLGFHTLYTYWVISYYFSSLTFVLEDEGTIVGFISGIMSVDKPATAFIWQIGLKSSYRNKGYAQALIDKFVTSAQSLGASKVQFTIDPENTASLKAFHKYANKRGFKIEKKGILRLKDKFSEKEEILISIKPHIFPHGEIGPGKP